MQDMLKRENLPDRSDDYNPADLDEEYLPWDADRNLPLDGDDDE